MNKERAIEILKQEFALYILKYPSLCKKINEELSKSIDFNRDLALSILKLKQLDNYIEEKFRK